MKSYLLSAIWTAPVVAFVLEQVTFRIAYVEHFDFGGIPGFLPDREGTIAAADYVISSSVAFIVFTFGSLLVAIQVASGQLALGSSRPRCCATRPSDGRLRFSSIRCCLLSA
jgi:hypothetical protein